MRHWPPALAKSMSHMQPFSLGEIAIAALYSDDGWNVVHEQYRGNRIGNIDFVMQKNGVRVWVEVKSVAGSGLSTNQRKRIKELKHQGERVTVLMLKSKGIVSWMKNELGLDVRIS